MSQAPSGQNPTPLRV